MDFNDALDFVDSETISAADKFMQRTMLASFRWLKEQFPGREIDDIDYSELVEVFTKAWPGIAV